MLVLLDVWGTGVETVEQRNLACFRRLRADLFSWYASEHALDPGKNLYKLENLTPTMVSMDRVGLATKAAETGTLVGFCRHMSAKHAAALGECGRPLSLMGDSLLGMHDCMRRNPRVFPPGEHQTFVDLAKRVFLLA